MAVKVLKGKEVGGDIGSVCVCVCSCVHVCVYAGHYVLAEWTRQQLC